MEDSKPSIALRDDGGAMDSRFAELCKEGLGLDENTTRHAKVMFQETKHILLATMSSIGSGSPEEIERHWFAFVLYSVTRLSKRRGGQQDNDESGVALYQILRASRVKVVDFFNEVPQISLKAGYVISSLYGSDWEARLQLKELQADVVHLVLLSRYYRRAYQELFLTHTTSCQKASCSGQCAPEYYKFGWLLFLALRVHALSHCKDLVSCSNGIVAILAILIIHVPVSLRKLTINSSPHFAKKTLKGVDLVASLSDVHHTSEDELRRTLGQACDLITNILKKDPFAASQRNEDTLFHLDPDNLTYFKDLLEENSLRSSLAVLEEDYEKAISFDGFLDERMFVNDEESLLGSGSLSGGAVNFSGTKRKFDEILSPSKMKPSPLSPPRTPASIAKGNAFGYANMTPTTPVSSALTTAKWLRTIISPLPSKPSADLSSFFATCLKDVTEDVTRRANIILGAIFPIHSSGDRCNSVNPQGSALLDSIWTEQRKMEALKLYYKVLESMCKAESRSQKDQNLSSLLSNERFHRCMLACSAELVLATYKTVTMMFPAVLERAGITSFDLSKVIEGFVRHEETLPRELKRHLNSLEEKLLESLSWDRGSSMYNCLIIARPDLSVEIKRLGLLAEPMPSLDAIALHYNVDNGKLPPLPTQRRSISIDQKEDVRSPKGESRSILLDRHSFSSPIKERLLTMNSLKTLLMQSAFASPSRPNPSGHGETYAETGIKVFFSKIVKLGANRIRSLSERMQLSQQTLERIYSLFQQILSKQTALFFNRHIDQLILCSFYGVAKISQLNLTFKEIIYNYRKQPQCKPQVFRSVFVDPSSRNSNGKKGPDHVDIITFYNEVFIPTVKPLLVDLSSAPASPSPNKILEDRCTTNGQVLGSPRLSSFPSLPDMSPKRVHASHNVYVSPLRSSKMDALLSPSSKSFYACVGESTHAYRSPSKDLMAINNRLNSGKKVSARLNFDIVSDSIVARSLVTQEQKDAGSVAPAADAAANAELPMKHEKPDT